jgi:asparagine N-glycosylation enzyme membrane subunit Stt3
MTMKASLSVTTQRIEVSKPAEARDRHGVAAVVMLSAVLQACLTWRIWGARSAKWALLPVALALIGPVWQYGLDGFGTITFAAACCAVAVVSEMATRRAMTNRLVLLSLVISLAGLISRKASSSLR